MQQPDLEFNLCWVFDQLTRGDGSAADFSGRASAARRRSSSHSSEHGGGGDGDGAGGPVLTLSHLRRVFSFLSVQLSDEELEEVLRMIDDDADGRATQHDFMHAIKGRGGEGGHAYACVRRSGGDKHHARAKLRAVGSFSFAPAVTAAATAAATASLLRSLSVLPVVHRSTPFDSRYAVNLAWSSLDGSTKDGVLSEEDSRAAREALGRAWGCDNEAEFNASVRAAHALQAQPERSVLSVHSDSTGSLPASPAHNYSSGLGGDSRGGDGGGEPRE